jgi:hypothetical protein
LVQDWVGGSVVNYGMWIEEIPVQGSSNAFFDSSDAVESQRPILTVNFSQPSVPEPATLIVWSFLGGLGAVFGWRRRKPAG